MSGILQSFAYGRAFSTVPANTVAPVVSGTATFGQTLSSTTGTWSGIPTPTYTYQWQRAGSNIGGATSSTYVLVQADVGSTIRCVVTATNVAGSTSANSNSTSTVAAIVPGAPTIGTATATGSTTATVSYTAPASNGGATITSYTAVSSPGSITGSLSTAGSGTITVSGLSASTSYTFVVYATNSVGNSSNSGSSNSITTQASYWFAFTSLYGNGNSSAGRGSADTSGVTAMINGGTSYAIRLSAAGAAVSSARLSTNSGLISNNNAPVSGSYSNAPLGTAANSTGSALYGVGWYDDGGNFAATIASTNASGSLNWWKGLTKSSASQYTGQSLLLGTDGFLYTGAWQYPYQAYARYASDGTLQWQRRFSVSNTGGGGCIGDGTDVYCFTTYNSAPSQYGYLIKYDRTADIKAYVVRLTPQNNNASNWSIFRSATLYGGYLYISGTVYEQAGLQNLYSAAALWKINPSNGSIVWQYYVKENGETNYGNDIVAGPDGYLYFTSSNMNSYRHCVTKLDVNASVSWQRMIYQSAGTGLPTTPPNVSISSDAIMYVTLTQSNGYTMVAKLPTDGSKQGTYAGPSSSTWTYTSFSSWGSLGSDYYMYSTSDSLISISNSNTTFANTSASAGASVTLLTNI